MGALLIGLHPPRLQIPPNNPAGPQHVCFSYTTEHSTGCPGTIFDLRAKQRRPCSRLHIDLSSSEFSTLAPSVYQPLMDWLAQHDVSPRFTASPHLRDKML